MWGLVLGFGGGSTTSPTNLLSCVNDLSCSSRQRARWVVDGVGRAKLGLWLSRLVLEFVGVLAHSPTNLLELSHPQGLAKLKQVCR